MQGSIKSWEFLKGVLKSAKTAVFSSFSSFNTPGHKPYLLGQGNTINDTGDTGPNPGRLGRGFSSFNGFIPGFQRFYPIYDTVSPEGGSRLWLRGVNNR